MIVLPSANVGRYAPSTLGRLQHQLTTPSFRLTEALYAGNLRFPSHAHEYASITAVFSGGFTESFRHKHEACAARSVLIKPAAETHANAYGPIPTRCLLIAAVVPPIPLTTLFSRTQHLKGGQPYSLALALERELRIGDDVAPLAAEGLVLELLCGISRETPDSNAGRVPHWLRLLRDELREHCCERITPERIGAITGFHPVYASRLFRRHFGCPPMEFVRRCRIEWATRALLETRLAIAAIGLHAGFSDQSHFTRSLTRYTGRTPGEIRRSGRPTGSNGLLGS